MEREILEKNLREVRARLDAASRRWGHVDICAVTKTVDAQTIDLACELGVRVIGENRVQELAGKYDRSTGANCFTRSTAARRLWASPCRC